MKTSGDILTKMRTITFFQNEGKDMNIVENLVVELKKELIRHKRKKKSFQILKLTVSLLLFSH